jgi:hypothetical protein
MCFELCPLTICKAGILSKLFDTALCFPFHSCEIISVFVCCLINKNSTEAVCLCLREKFIPCGCVNVSSLLFPLTRFGFTHYPISVAPLVLLKTLFSYTTHHDFRQHFFKVRIFFHFYVKLQSSLLVCAACMYTRRLCGVCVFLFYFPFLRHES